MVVPRPRRSAGSALVELAFMLPLLIAILLVLIDFGYLMYVQTALHTAVRQGVYAGIHDTVWTKQQIELITFQSDLGRNFRQSEVTATLLSTDPSFGTTLPTCEVSIAHPHKFLVPFALPTILQTQQTITLRARAKSIVVRGLKFR